MAILAPVVLLIVSLLAITASATGYDSVLKHAARSMVTAEPIPLFQPWEQEVYHGCGTTRRVAIQGEGVLLIGEIYEPATAGKRPAVLIKHGFSPIGRKLAFVRVLACELSQQGYLVLATDQRDFGESDKTPPRDTRIGLELLDVEAELRFLAALPEVDSNRISIVGHSMGAGVALGAVATGYAPGVGALVAIGPPRRVAERILQPNAPDYQKFYKRFLDQRDPSAPSGPEVYRADVVTRAPETYQDYYSSSDHVPILLLDGEREDARDRAFLRNYFDEIAPPKAYITQPGVGHYVATYGLTPSNSIVLYHGEHMNQLVGYIDTWISRHTEAQYKSRADEHGLPSARARTHCDVACRRELPAIASST